MNSLLVDTMFTLFSTCVTLPRPDAEVAGECRPVFELPGVKQRLVVTGEFERIAGFIRGRRNLRFGVAGTVPGVEGNDGRCSM